MYDYLIVGAGITAATCAASISPRGKRCLVVDCREHVGGNCYDYPAAGGYVHHYGPHIFHTKNREVINFLSVYTGWRPYEHSVTAEIDIGGRFAQLPFPYSRQTEEALSARLGDDQIIDLFFRGYSQKMWGCAWEEMPAAIRNRVPKRQEESDYFPDEFCAMPDRGYAELIRRMLAGADVVLGVAPGDWMELADQAKQVIYTGRVDLLPGVTRSDDDLLRHRTLQLSLRTDLDWTVPSPVLNICHVRDRNTRMTSMAALTGGRSRAVMVERPREAQRYELAPFYPMTWQEERDKHDRLMAKAKKLYPKLHFLGRLATYRYLDMHQAVGAALHYCEKVLSD